MDNLSKDIQSVGFDTRPPMLDREKLAECEEGVLHLGVERDRVFADLSLEEKDRFMTAVKLNKGLKESNYCQLYAYLKQHGAHDNENKMMLERYNPHAIVPLALGRQNKGQVNYARKVVAARNGGVQNRVGNANPGQARQIKCYNCNGIGYIARNCTQPMRLQDSEYFKDKMLLMQAQENGSVLDEE
nr:retrovirus-related Pol polyprotein from transposon TNT 1-94 [Tanacetum cinerariifolium]